MTCLNCNAKLSCGCQKKVATDGKQVCSSCLTSYQKKINAANATSNSVTSVKAKFNPSKK